MNDNGPIPSGDFLQEWLDTPMTEEKKEEYEKSTTRCFGT